MSFKKYIYKNGNLKLVIEEDPVGYYLFVYRDKKIVPDEDYLQDGLEEIFFEAQERFGVHRDEWIEL